MITITPTLIKQIMDQLETGVRVFVHKSNGTLRTFMDQGNFMDLDDGTEAVFQQFLKRASADYVEVERCGSREAFEIMADFAEQLEGDPALQQRLFAALNKPKPFSHFKFVIDNAGPQRQRWTAFMNARRQRDVEKQLAALNESTDVQ